MEEKRRRESVLERAARLADLPADGVAGLPCLSLIGDGELRIENHRGILAYGTEEIHVGGGKMVLRIRGTGLQLRAMNASELLITGQILAVELM